MWCGDNTDHGQTATLQRQALREYCKMDTLAMVRIVDYLKMVG